MADALRFMKKMIYLLLSAAGAALCKQAFFSATHRVVEKMLSSIWRRTAAIMNKSERADRNPDEIITDDTTIPMGLIGDLFSAPDVHRNLDLEFELQVRQVTIDLTLQPEDNFVL